MFERPILKRNGKRHIRVVALSRSLDIVDKDQAHRALERLEQTFAVSFADGAFERVHLDGPSLNTRLKDLDRALSDDSVDIVMSAIGGYSCAELLPYMEYTAFAKARKVFCGFSDISVLLNNISLGARLQTLCGPHFSSFGHPICAGEIESSFHRALDPLVDFELRSFPAWGDESWYFDNDWSLRPNKGPRCLQSGVASGVAIGGNVVSLAGNLPPEDRWPSRTVLFAEMHSGYAFFDFLRWLGTILRNVPRGTLAAVLLGKLPTNIILSIEAEKQLLEVVSSYCGGPLVVDLDFGHNVPFFTFPIGADIFVQGDNQGSRIVVRALTA